ncbi:MAG: hypothetical protein ACTSSB_02095 [Candidatus Heimdallarchaeota archaeon]
MGETKENMNKVSGIKNKVQKLSNKNLLSEWKTIREINSSCLINDFTSCSICYNKSNCIFHLKYEEVLTEELLERGLLTLAFNVNEDECINANNSVIDLITFIKNSQVNIPS